MDAAAFGQPIEYFPAVMIPVGMACQHVNAPVATRPFVERHLPRPGQAAPVIIDNNRIRAKLDCKSAVIQVKYIQIHFNIIFPIPPPPKRGASLKTKKDSSLH